VATASVAPQTGTLAVSHRNGGFAASGTARHGFRAIRARLEQVHGALPDDRVSLGWLHNELEAQATYLLILVLALVGTLPGASLPVGLAICALALRMMLRCECALPETLAAREIAAGHARSALGHAIRVMRVCERAFPQRRAEDATAAFRPVAGALLFGLGAMLLIPIPLSNVLPALAAAAIALALTEGSLMLVIASSVGAAASFAVTAVMVTAATTAIAHI
jgi:hypothetical protein